MENLLCCRRPKDPRRRAAGNRASLFGLLLTDKGGRWPLPRKSYYTKGYCRKKRRRYPRLNDPAAAMTRAVAVSGDGELTVVYDGAFDARQVHRASPRKPLSPIVCP